MAGEDGESLIFCRESLQSYLNGDPGYEKFSWESPGDAVNRRLEDNQLTYHIMSRMIEV